MHVSEGMKSSYGLEMYNHHIGAILLDSGTNAPLGAVTDIE